MTHHLTKLKSVLEYIQSLDATELLVEYLKADHAAQAGTYVALVLDPKEEDYFIRNTPSWEETCDEYYQESGALSQLTLLSGTRDHYTAGADDGWEWEYCDKSEATHFHKKDNYDWDVIENWNEDNNESDFEFFVVSDTPVDGWENTVSEHDIESVEKQLNKLIESIEEELAKL